jgi:RNA-directed DNA polymerase
MFSLHTNADQLARAFVAGKLEPVGLVERGRVLLGRRWKWLPKVARLVAAEFGGKKRPTVPVLARFLRHLRVPAGKSRDADENTRHFKLSFRQPIRPCFVPCDELAESHELRKLDTVAEVAAWLELTPSELDWFADRQGRNNQESSQRLQHYSYHWRKKRSGGMRLVEAPKSRLKNVQRKILREILDAIPVHDAAHGFRHRRSIVSCVQGHVGQALVLRMDVADFFPSIAQSRVVGLLMWVGYPEEVARTIGAICTNDTPPHVLDFNPLPLSYQQRRRWDETFRRPHLPQGAPTSPVLANLCAYRLDARLTGLARSADATYTRYADDLIFSGGESFRRGVRRFRIYVHSVVLEEGFRIVEQKSRIMPRGVRQHAVGIVLNDHPNTPRNQFELLKAILHNAAKFGPQSQNRERHPDFRAHLSGSVAHVETVNPARGRKLRLLFNRINWQ